MQNTMVLQGRGSLLGNKKNKSAREEKRKKEQMHHSGLNALESHLFAGKMNPKDG